MTSLKPLFYQDLIGLIDVNCQLEVGSYFYKAQDATKIKSTFIGGARRLDKSKSPQKTTGISACAQ